VGTLAKVVDRMPSLQHVFVARNPGFPTDNATHRIALLATVERAARLGFSLSLNGSPVTLDERISAVEQRKVNGNGHGIVNELRLGFSNTTRNPEGTLGHSNVYVNVM
jgi:hypothetical protein